MDDLGAAISGFLAQPDAMEQLSAAAKQLGLGNPAEAAATGLLESIREEPEETAALLEALRPLLGPGKQEKLDRAAKALRLMRTAKRLSRTIEL
jgi:hypothetical protein